MIISIWVFIIMGVAAYTDLKYKIIPNTLLIIGTAGTLVLLPFVGDLPWWNYVLAAIAAGGLLLLISYFSGGGIGGGDIKFMAWLGITTGLSFTVGVLFVGTVVGIFYGLTQRGKSFPLAHCWLIGACVITIMQ